MSCYCNSESCILMFCDMLITEVMEATKRAQGMFKNVFHFNGRKSNLTFRRSKNWLKPSRNCKVRGETGRNEKCTQRFSRKTEGKGAYWVAKLKDNFKTIAFFKMHRILVRNWNTWLRNEKAAGWGTEPVSLSLFLQATSGMHQQSLAVHTGDCF